ncbi:hypothetical protein [Fastidiosibacter lacustris]|uniref:hypothetical protein n=1 Tax=Fastidiosibacter lacustris TaxID=2056695 RepID=UPI000E348139|nr:hypothetical protein [Fastidiosibacter lacustris]
MLKFLSSLLLALYSVISFASSTGENVEVEIDATLVVKPWFSIEVNANDIVFRNDVSSVLSGITGINNNHDYIYAGKSQEVGFLSNIANPQYTIKCNKGMMTLSGSTTSQQIIPESYLCINGTAQALGTAPVRLPPQVPNQKFNLLLLVKQKSGTAYPQGQYRGQLICTVSVNF